MEAVHIPFKGGAEAMSEVIAGRLDFFFEPVKLVLPNIREASWSRSLVNGHSRSEALPAVQTTLEAGFKDAEYPIWFGLFLPTTTPRDIVDALNRENIKAGPRLPRLPADLGQLNAAAVTPSKTPALDHLISEPYGRAEA